MTFRPINFQIDAVDDNQRMIRIGSSGFKVGSYYLHFHTPPPTHHSEAMEKEILSFFSDVLGCRVRGVVRGDNGPETSAYYAEVFKARREKIRQANREL
jgi:hypothetical protein